MKNIIIAGASGMIGSIVLRECLNSPLVNKVTSIVRRASGLNHPKLKEIIHDDFTDYSSISVDFQHQDAAHFCIGAYTGTVADDQFKIITVDFAKAFGDALKENSPNVTFCLLSGQGADSKEKSRISFARYKGMAENHLLNLNLGSLYIFRPGYIYPVEKREEPNFTYRISRRLYPLLKRVYNSGVITSEELGRAMFKAGIKGNGQVILENKEIKRFL